MKSKEKHTFVICAYKESPFLEECIRSLKNQTVPSQIILYTSTPNESIAEICEKYNIPFFNGEGGTIGKDWNNALSFVNTKYATIAHQDDVYRPDYLELIMDSLEKYPDTLIAFSDYREWKNGRVININTNLKIKKMMLHALDLFPKSIFWRRRILALGNPICCPAVTYNLSKLGKISFHQNMKVSLDWKAWSDISKLKGRFSYVKRDLMWHRIHEDSETTNTIENHSRSIEDQAMFEEFWPKFFARFIMKFYIKSQNTNS